MRVLLIAFTLVAVAGVALAIGVACNQHALVELWWACLFYGEVKEWQTFLAAGLGFAGLIWVARQGYAGIKLSTESAANLAKRAANLALQLAHEQRSYELHGLARALSAEIVSVRFVTATSIKSLEEILGRGPAGVPSEFMDLARFPVAIYHANTSVIGRLGEKLAPQVVEFYGHVENVESRLRHVSQSEAAYVQPQLTEGIVKLLSKLMDKEDSLSPNLSRDLDAFADDLMAPSAATTKTASDDGAPTG